MLLPITPRCQCPGPRLGSVDLIHRTLHSAGTLPGVAPRLRLVAVTSSFLDVLASYHQCLCGEWAWWLPSPWY